MQMLSFSGAFPDFICYITCVSSYSVGTHVAISTSSFGVGRGSAVMVTDSLFRTSVKCSTHLLAWVSSVVREFPSLPLTMLTLCLGVSLCKLYSFPLSLQRFPLSLQYCPHELSCHAERFS